MKRARPKGQHYVPRFYLDYFADADGFVHTYDKQRGICRGAKPEDTAKESNFYSFDGENGEHLDHLESTLSEIESLAAPLHARLIAGQIPKNDDRAAYALFLATLYIRTPAMVNAMAGFYGDIAQIGNMVAGDRLNPETLIAEFEAEQGSPLGPEDRERISTLFSDKKNIIMNVDRRVGLNSLNAAPEIANMMVAMSWVVLDIDGSDLITSDDSVVRISPPEA